MNKISDHPSCFVIGLGYFKGNIIITAVNIGIVMFIVMNDFIDDALRLKGSCGRIKIDKVLVVPYHRKIISDLFYIEHISSTLLIALS